MGGIETDASELSELTKSPVSKDAGLFVCIYEAEYESASDVSLNALNPCDQVWSAPWRSLTDFELLSATRPYGLSSILLLEDRRAIPE